MHAPPRVASKEHRVAFEVELGNLGNLEARHRQQIQVKHPSPPYHHMPQQRPSTRTARPNPVAPTRRGERHDASGRVRSGPALIWPGFLLSILLAGQGCGMPLGSSRRVILGYHVISADHASQKTVIPGLDVRYHTGHDGFSLGWSGVSISSPSNPADPSNAVESPRGTEPSFLPPLSIAWTRDGQRHALGCLVVRNPILNPSEPRFIHATQAGLLMPINPHHTGLHLSIQRHTWLLVPPDADGAWRVHVEPGQLPSLQSNTSPNTTTTPSP